MSRFRRRAIRHQTIYRLPDRCGLRDFQTHPPTFRPAGSGRPDHTCGDCIACETTRYFCFPPLELILPKIPPKTIVAGQTVQKSSVPSGG